MIMLVIVAVIYLLVIVKFRFFLQVALGENDFKFWIKRNSNPALRLALITCTGI
jgi:hypothetical protein